MCLEAFVQACLSAARCEAAFIFSSSVMDLSCVMAQYLYIFDLQDEASTLLRALENSGAVHIRSNLVHLRPSELMDMVCRISMSSYLLW